MQAGKGGIVANPNCSTIIALMAVTPLHKVNPVKRMVVSTYQAASGAGQAAMDELEAQTRAVLNDEPPPMEIFPFQYAFNLFSHNAPMTDNGYNEEVSPWRLLPCTACSVAQPCEPALDSMLWPRTPCSAALPCPAASRATTAAASLCRLYRSVGCIALQAVSLCRLLMGTRSEARQPHTQSDGISPCHR